MNILNYATPTHVKNFSNVLDDLFNTNFSNIIDTEFTHTKPSVNVIENKDNYAIEVAAPGLDKNDFKITVEKDQLIIEATLENNEEESSDAIKYRRKEFNFQSFKRSFHISNKINSEKIDAQYKNGILTVTLDKREEAKDKAPRNITIN